MRLWTLCVAVLLSLCACVAPPGPMERLNFTAHEMNVATRFGRMDVAVSHVAASAQDDFIQRHAKWGRDLRIVDVELSGMRLVTSDTAEVRLTVSWHRIDESTMRMSAVQQKWMMGKDGWELAEEMRVAGSPGVFTLARHRSEDAVQLPNPNAGQI